VFHYFPLFSQEKHIKRIDKQFDLVLMADHFDESMVLLAQELCWPIDHVKSFRLNARKASYKVDLTAQERETLASWQKGDMALYSHFESIFRQKVFPFL